MGIDKVRREEVCKNVIAIDVKACVCAGIEAVRDVIRVKNALFVHFHVQVGLPPSTITLNGSYVHLG